MRRPHFHPACCKVCGRGEAQGVTVSQTGLCPEHGHERLVANVMAMKTKRGPYAQWWAYRMAVSVGYAPLDSAPPRP